MDIEVQASDTAYSMIETYDGEGFDSDSELRSLSVLVDMALFRIYVELNHSLLGSLFRVRNYLDDKEVELVLSEKQKWNELVEYYKGKKQHEKALDVLKR